MIKFGFQEVPFEIAKSPPYFQQLINEVLRGLDLAFGYLDDIFIYSPNPETHLRYIGVIFQCLLNTRLKLKKIKCNFLKKHIQYLGHLISEIGIETLPEKVSHLHDMPTHRNLKEVNQF